MNLGICKHGLQICLKAGVEIRNCRFWRKPPAHAILQRNLQKFSSPTFYYQLNYSGFWCKSHAHSQSPKVQLSNVLLPTQLQWVLAQIARTFTTSKNSAFQRFITDSIIVGSGACNLQALHYHLIPTRPHSSVTACMINQFSKWLSNFQKHDF